MATNIPRAKFHTVAGEWGSGFEVREEDRQMEADRRRIRANGSLPGTSQTRSLDFTTGSRTTKAKTGTWFDGPVWRDYQELEALREMERLCGSFQPDVLKLRPRVLRSSMRGNRRSW